MKYLQVGILAALILVAGLLGLNLMQDRQAEPPFQPIPATTAEAPSAPAEELEPASDPTSESIAANLRANDAAKPTGSNSAAKPEVDASAGQTATPKTQALVTPPKPRSTATRPSPSRQETVAATTPSSQRVDSSNSAPKQEAIIVEPPASTTESWGTPPETSTAQDRERYELMRPQRKDPAPQDKVAAASSIPEPPRSVTLPSGTILTVRTTRALSSESSAVDDTFTGTLDQPIVHEDLIIAERGSKVDGRVVQVVESGRVKGLAALSIQLTSISTSDGQTVPVQTQTFTMEAEKSGKGDAAKVGIATGIGAALGAIFGGGKGAAIGAAAGAGAGTGSVLTSKGKPAEIPSETRINFRLESPLTLTEKINP